MAAIWHTITKTGYSSPTSVARTIANARAGVMPAWGSRLDPATINMLTVYVHALGGGEQ